MSMALNRICGGRAGGWWVMARRRRGSSAALALLLVSMAQGMPRQQAGTMTLVPAARQARNVAVITIDREIDRTMARSVKRRMKAAAEGGADAIVFELDTPGGDLGAVLEICTLIKTSPVPNTVAWVHTQAYSGGAAIALACREMVVSDVSRMGAAAVIVADMFGQLNALPETERQKLMGPWLGELVDSARRRGYDEKLVQGLVSRGVELWLVENTTTGQRLFIDRAEHQLLFGEPPETEPTTLAAASGAPVPEPIADDSPNSGRRGRFRHGGAPPPVVPGPREAPSPPTPADFQPASPLLGPQAVKDITVRQQFATARPVLTEAERGQWRKLEKVSDGKGIFTFNESQLLRYGLAAKTVKNDEQLKSFFGATNLRRLDESWSESLVVFLVNNYVRGLLIVVLLLGLFIEMTHPGLILPGAVAMVSLVLLIAPPMLNDMANWWEVAAILVGLVFIALEILVIPGFGFFGVAGILLFFGGLMGTFVGGGEGLFPDSPKGRSDLLYGLTTILISAATSGVLMYFVGKHLGSLPILNRLVLKDDSGQSDEGLLAAMDPLPRGGLQVGVVGTALTPLRPAGRVQVGDKIFDVVADMGFINSGELVRIASVDAFRVSVERVGNPPGPGTPGEIAEGGTGGATA